MLKLKIQMQVTQIIEENIWLKPFHFAIMAN